jgi:hypothetical protein
MGERLERVVHENQLRPGLLVEARDCICGRRRCRSLLGSKSGRDNCDGCERAVCDAGFVELVPCAEPDAGLDTCFFWAIENGDLFIVNPFDDQAETTTKAKPRKRERSR